MQPEHRTKLRARLAIPAGLFVLLNLWICLFAQPAALGLVGPDEPRYAFIARSMAATGDWVTPRLYGRPWFEKPILYYWTAGIFYRIGGRGEVPARLPSALAALATTLAVAWIAARFYGREAGFYSLLILPGSVAFVGFARSATPDMPFCAMLTIALATAAKICLSREFQSDRDGDSPPRETTPRGALLIFGAALGLATLAKGPAALILAGGSVGMWAAISRQWRCAFQLARAESVIAYCLVALPWYVICARRNPDFLRVFLLQHNFERYLTPMFQHRQPVWFFAPILLLGIFPWTAALAWRAVDAGRARRTGRWRKSSALFFFCWMIFPVGFFSLSQSKLPAYILPAFPPLALLLAAGLSRQQSSANRTRTIFAAIGGSWILVAASAPAWWKKIPPSAFGAARGELILLAAVGGVAIISAALTGRMRVAVMSTALLTMLLIEFANIRMLPRLDPFLSARAAAQQTQTMDDCARRVAGYRLKRDWQYGLSFYLGNELPEWTPEANVTPAASNAPGPRCVFTDASQLSAIQREYPAAVVVAEPSPRAVLLRLGD